MGPMLLTPMSRTDPTPPDTLLNVHQNEKSPAIMGFLVGVQLAVGRLGQQWCGLAGGGGGEHVDEVGVQAAVLQAAGGVRRQ